MQRISKDQFDREGVSLVVFLRIAPELFRIGTCQGDRFFSTEFFIAAIRTLDPFQQCSFKML